LSILLATTTALAQQNVPPPPKPAPDGPSLEVTLKFIQEKIEEVGKLNYAVYLHDSANNNDWVNQQSAEWSNVVASPALCRISYHWHVTENDKVRVDGDFWFSLQTVQDVVVMPFEQDFKLANTNNGHPTWGSKVNPSMWSLIARRPKGFANTFYFREEAMANRMAKALVHAVELCGGGKKEEPFKADGVVPRSPEATAAESSVAKPQPQPQPQPESPPQPQLPADRRLAINEIEKLLKGSVSPARVTTLVQQYGVNFELSDEVEKQLRGLGADDKLLIAIAKNHR
jgi:hypothetical protein